MLRAAAEERGLVALEAVYHAAADDPGMLQQVGQRPCIMVRRFGRRVFHIGGPKDLYPCLVVVQTGEEEAEVEVGEMTGVLLHGPLAVDAAGQLFGRPRLQTVGEPRGRAAEPLDELGIEVHRKREVETAFAPGDACGHGSAAPGQLQPSTYSTAGITPPR